MKILSLLALFTLFSCTENAIEFQDYVDLAVKLHANSNIKEMTGHRVNENTINGKQVVLKSEEYEPEMGDEGVFFFLSVLKDEAIPTLEYKERRNDMITLEIEQYLAKPNHSVFITHVKNGTIKGFIFHHNGPDLKQVKINSKYTAQLEEEVRRGLYKFTATGN